MMFNRAAKVALPTTDNDFKKNFWIASLGIRLDSAMVVSKNLGVNIGDINWNGGNHNKIKPYMKIASGHSEVRALKKMDGGVLFVVRVGKEEFFETGMFDFKMARPCNICEQHIVAKKISKVYYTINDHQYGIMDIRNNKDVVREF